MLQSAWLSWSRPSLFRRLETSVGNLVFIGPEFYLWREVRRPASHELSLKREYSAISELLKLLVSVGPNGLINGLEQADNRFKGWLDLNGSWSVTPSKAENEKSVRAAAEPIERILDVLDAAGKDEIVVVPETNSLLANADPTAYRDIAGQKAFVFMLLPHLGRTRQTQGRTSKPRMCAKKRGRSLVE